MQQFQPIIINFKGGIISPGHLLELLDAAANAHVSHARFGLRQQLMLEIPYKKFPDFRLTCNEKNIRFYEAGKAAPNIVSSYCAATIFTADTWLTEGVYKDVFDLFRYEPVLKVNICDSKQSLVPFYSGHLNWLSSQQIHFWQLALRFPGTGNIYHWPELIYTNDIGRISATIEQLLLENEALFRSNEDADGGRLWGTVKQQLSYISRPCDSQMELAVFHLPYYEGFNKDGETSWLGIYRRDELFPINFLRDVCTTCLASKIGQFYSTAWKSIIIKGIVNTQRRVWDEVLGTYRINVRHAANELNWQVEDNCEDGLILKRHIIRYFDVEDVRTYGLSFAVKTNASNGVFGSVVIRKQKPKHNSRLKSMDRFEILYTRDFNPNSTDLVLFRKDVSKEQLGIYLVSLCKFFYEQAGSNKVNTARQPEKPVQVAELLLTNNIYQCKHCLTVYDESVGEAENDIAAGTLFQHLPSGYTCPLCESTKEAFIIRDCSTVPLQL